MEEGVSTMGWIGSEDVHGADHRVAGSGLSKPRHAKVSGFEQSGSQLSLN